MSCELSGQPVIIDGRAICHACGRLVPIRATNDGLLVFIEHPEHVCEFCGEPAPEEQYHPDWHDDGAAMRSCDACLEPRTSARPSLSSLEPTEPNRTSLSFSSDSAPGQTQGNARSSADG